MDYDKTAIAATYDAARSYRPDIMARWLDLVASHLSSSPSLIVDVGCGTGRFTHPLAERFRQARVIGIDPSETMLASARSKLANGQVEFRQAPAEELPVADGSADVVFMSMMLHHLDDRPRAARECARVLGSEGRLIVRNSTRDSLYPQKRFFPGFQAIVDSQLPSRDEIVVMFERAGLPLEGYRLVPQPVAESWQELADKLALRADSFIVRLPQSAFEVGMAALRAHAEREDPQQVVEHIHFFAFGV
jgi:ubiquinone/menaquinone biosynthesis C-methylase UbiE